MNIYEIGQDFDNYKFFVFKEDDESNKGVWDYNGQSLINEWKGLSLELFRDKRKKKDKRSEEFDASCYFSGCLIVNKRTSLLLSEKLKGQIEVLPVNVDGNASGFYFRFSSVRLNRLRNKLLANYLKSGGNELATVRISAFCVAMLSNNSFICKYSIFFRKYELSAAVL